MPLLQEKLPVLYNDLVNVGQLMSTKTPYVRKRHRLQPILRVPSGVGHMNVWRFTPFHAEEEITVSTDPQQRGHIGTLLQ
jgi:hypothetical protein